MTRFDHLRIPVSSLARSRDWYTRTLGLAVEFEVPDRQAVAIEPISPAGISRLSAESTRTS
jgi:catechol 2,3-dioxygenase-like lactoylglutathione lyase family enzyme